MGSNFSDVGKFHDRFGLDNVTFRPVRPRDINPELMDFRIRFLREELTEFEDGYAEGDVVRMFDALLDLAYVTFGTAHLMGLPWQVGWDEVHAANMMKTRAASDGSDSKRSSGFDVVKPAGWVPPDLTTILRRYGWNIKS